MRILIIEDEPSVSSFIKKGLEENGYNTEQAFDGLTGIRLASQNVYDLILLDIIMPGINGLEVCEKLRKEVGYKNPIIMLTALGTSDDVVVMQHNLALVQAFVEQGVQMDFFPYPMHKHNVRGKDRVHLMTNVLNYVIEHNK